MGVTWLILNTSARSSCLIRTGNCAPHIFIFLCWLELRHLIVFLILLFGWRFRDKWTLGVSHEVPHKSRRWQQSLHICTNCTCAFFFRGSVEACLSACLSNRTRFLLEPPRADLESIHQNFPGKGPSRKKSTNLSHHGKRHPGAPSALWMKRLSSRASRHPLLAAWFLPDSTSLYQSLRMSGSAGCLLNRPLWAWVATHQLPLFRHHPWHFPQRNLPSTGLL